MKKLSGLTSDFYFTSDIKSSKSWSYSGTYVPGVFSYDENSATEQYGESYLSSDAEVSDGAIGGEDDSDEDDDIIDEDLNVDETAVTDAPDVQLSTGELTKYDITGPGVFGLLPMMMEKIV